MYISRSILTNKSRKLTWIAVDVGLACAAAAHGETRLIKRSFHLSRACHHHISTRLQVNKMEPTIRAQIDGARCHRASFVVVNAHRQIVTIDKGYWEDQRRLLLADDCHAESDLPSYQSLLPAPSRVHSATVAGGTP